MIHYDHAIAELLYKGDIMADEKNRHVKLLAQFYKQFDDLRLDRNI